MPQRKPEQANPVLYWLAVTLAWAVAIMIVLRFTSLGPFVQYMLGV